MIENDNLQRPTRLSEGRQGRETTIGKTFYARNSCPALNVGNETDELDQVISPPGRRSPGPCPRRAIRCPRAAKCTQKPTKGIRKQSFQNYSSYSQKLS